jgi:hypothetical protein
MPRPILIVAALIVALGIIAAGCGDDENGEEPSPTSTTAAAEATPTSAAGETPGETPFAGGRDPVELPAGALPNGQPKLVDVRAAAHEGFDRIVFEFDKPQPGFRVEYVEEALGCGSGLPATIQGAALLQVKVQPSVAHDDAGNPTFAQQEIMPGLASILEAEQTCDFEADVTWVVGLTQEADFTAVSLLDPFRVVVDVAHP